MVQLSGMDRLTCQVADVTIRSAAGGGELIGAVVRGAGWLATVSVTVAAARTRKPPAGACATTIPVGTSGSAYCTIRTVSDCRDSSLDAAARLSPTTSGTRVVRGPWVAAGLLASVGGRVAPGGRWP